MAGRGDLTRSAVLALLGQEGPLSRADLARALDVSAATVTAVTRELIHGGLVVETQQAPSRGGRPAQLLALAGSTGAAVGAKVTADHVAIVCATLDGAVIGSWQESMDALAPDAPDRLADLLAGTVDELTARGTRLLGVGVCVPGDVDDQDVGTVTAPTLWGGPLQLGAILRSRLALPVLVENDVNALAVAERLYGRGRAHRDFLVLTIGRGIGAGVVVDRAVYRGAHGGAGEIGHIPVEPDGPTCTCGNRGCLEAVIGEQALVARGRAARLLRAGEGIDRLTARADAGSPRAVEIFADAGALLGRVVAGVANLVDPEIVVVLGEGTRGWRHWRPTFEPALRSHLLPARRSLPVEVDEWDDRAWALGAAALVLASPFDANGTTGTQGELVRARLRSEAVTPAGAGR